MITQIIKKSQPNFPDFGFSYRGKNLFGKVDVFWYGNLWRCKWVLQDNDPNETHILDSGDHEFEEWGDADAKAANIMRHFETVWNMKLSQSWVK